MFLAAAITLYLSVPSERRTKIGAGLPGSVCLKRLECAINLGSIPIILKMLSTY